MLLPETLKLHSKDRFEFIYGYFLPWKDQMVSKLNENGVQVMCFNASNNAEIIYKVWEVVKFVRQHKIQLIHAHLPWAGIVARIVGKFCNVPVIYTEHNLQERYHFLTRKVNLFTMNHLSRMVAVSQEVATSIRKHKINNAVPVDIILNGVNTDEFNPQFFRDDLVRKELGIPLDAPVIGTVAVFRFQKRLDLWMDLAASILETCQDVHFVIVGDGPLRESLIGKRIELGMEHRIHMPGLKTDVRNYLRMFDIYMLSSIYEGLPLALLEGMAMENAIITTDAGGVGQAVRHEIDGLVCSVTEPEKLVDFAVFLLNDPSSRLKYKKQARKRAIQSFSMEKMVFELEEIYQRFADGASARQNID